VLELVRFTGATRIHRLKRKDRKVTSSTGKRSAVKVARCVWAGGKGVSPYLSVPILDWYSRYVVSWELDQTLEMPFVLTAMQRALAQATPQICNSDQGSHFTSPPYAQLLLAADVQISMDGKGRALDNIFTERLWRTSKYEEVYMHEYASPKEARQQLRD
jgi:transposase InsO family protein